MEQERQKKSICIAVMEKIRNGQKAMRPRWHFVLISVLFITTLLIGILIFLFIISFIIFTLEGSGLWFLPGLGWRGMRTFFASLPWLLVLLGIILVILLEVLARRFSLAYRRPLLYHLIFIILITVVSSLLISHTSLHRNFNNLADRGELPWVGRIYRSFGPRSNQNVHLGVINEVMENGFKMDDRRGGVFSVMVTPETIFPSRKDFQTGDQIIVLGRRGDHTIRAESIDAVMFKPRIIPGRP